MTSDAEISQITYQVQSYCVRMNHKISQVQFSSVAFAIFIGKVSSRLPSNQRVPKRFSARRRDAGHLGGVPH